MTGPTPFEFAKVVMDRYDRECVTTDAGELAAALHGLIREHEALIAAFRDREAWIDPQRIVDLAKRRTDEGRTGIVSLQYVDGDPFYILPWQVEAFGDFHAARSAADALKGAEA